MEECGGESRPSVCTGSICKGFPGLVLLPAGFVGLCVCERERQDSGDGAYTGCDHTGTACIWPQGPLKLQLAQLNRNEVISDIMRQRETEK